MHYTRFFIFYGKFYDELKGIIKSYNDEIMEIKSDIGEKNIFKSFV